MDIDNFVYSDDDPSPLSKGHLKCATCGDVFKKSSPFASRQKWCESCSKNRRKMSHKLYHQKCLQDPIKASKIREYDRVRKYKKYHENKDDKGLDS